MLRPAVLRKALGSGALLVAGGAALRLILFNVRSLWFDEAITLRLAALPLREIAARAVVMEATPPLHPLLLKPWSALFADPLVAIRAFSWLTGVAGLAVFIALCRRLCAQRWRTPALLGAVSSFWIHLSQDGRCYSFFLLISLGQALLLLRLLERPGARAAAYYAALGAAGLYTHNFFALVLLSHGVWALGTRARAAWAAAAAAAVLAWLPWAPSFLRQLGVWKEVSVLSDPLTAAKLLELLGTWLFDPTFLGLALGPLVPSLGAAALLLLIFSLPALLRRDTARVSFVLLSVPFLAALSIEAVLGKPLVQARYLAPASPFLYILLAEAAHAWGAFAARVLRVALLTTAAVGALVYFISARWVDPRLDEVARRVRQAAPPGTAVVHLDAYHYLPLRYYYLPEMRHYLPPGVAKLTYWGGHPGYPAVLPAGGAAKLGRVLVLDPRRSVFTTTLGFIDGAELERALTRQ